MKFSGKKWMTLLAGVLVFAALAAGCGGGAKQSADKKELTFSKSQGPYSELFEKAVKPILAKKGYKITGKDMSDLLQADVVLNEGEVDFNVEQHTAYME
ncbi:MAG: MetQ/NlpA family ABC transporter substrate-binding protein, partial [Succiniclasticum sp.]|nr:MetQ/NlpA family ABC transporter substrate-binding protein [Succiniclasticum sp.]